MVRYLETLSAFIGMRLQRHHTHKTEINTLTYKLRKIPVELGGFDPYQRIIVEFKRSGLWEPRGYLDLFSILQNTDPLHRDYKTEIAQLGNLLNVEVAIR